jgi:hypothetical protein
MFFYTIMFWDSNYSPANLSGGKKRRTRGRKSRRSKASKSWKAPRSMGSAYRRTRSFLGLR